MPPQNILISLRFAPLHQDILHRGLDKRQYSIYTEKGKRATDQPLSVQSHFSAVDDFTEIFLQSHFLWTQDGFTVTMKKSSNISVTDLHRFIPQPASGRSSELSLLSFCPFWTASLVWSKFWRLLRLNGLIFRTV